MKLLANLCAVGLFERAGRNRAPTRPPPPQRRPLRLRPPHKRRPPTRQPPRQKRKGAQKEGGEENAPKKKDLASQLKTVPLVAGQATVIASNVNVRGQAKLNSEVITKLNKGDTVAGARGGHSKEVRRDEPSAWAKIILPASAHAWVNAPFIDATNRPSFLKAEASGRAGREL